MSRKILLSFASGAIALAATACAAVAAPIDLGAIQQSGDQASLVLVRGGGGGGGGGGGHGGGGFGGGFGGGHGGGFGGFHGHSMGGQRFASRTFNRSNLHGHNVGHRRRFFFAGNPYFYDDYYDDGDDSSCWWSSRSRHWVCPGY